MAVIRLPALISKRGSVTITEVLVAMGIAFAALFAFLSLSARNRTQEIRIDRTVLSKKILVNTIGNLESLTFESLIQACSSVGPLGNNLLSQSKCGEGPMVGPLTSGAEVGAFDSLGGRKFFDVRMDLATGIPSKTGNSCIALVKCEEIVKGSMLQLTLVSLFTDPDNPNKLNPVYQVYTRGKW